MFQNFCNDGPQISILPDLDFIYLQSVLQERIESRDNLRRELFDRLKMTIEELNKVPLQARGKEVQVNTPSPPFFFFL